MLGNKPPYTTMQQLNLDWVLSKLKTLLRLVPDDGAVGQILRRTRDGAVWSDEQGGGGGGAVQSVNGKTGAVVLDAADVGALPDDYTPPVTSVNGQTGAVTVSVPVQSVNGKTGAVVLDADDVGALPDDYTPPVTSVNGQTGAVVLDADDVGALPDALPHITEIGTATGGWSWILYDDNTVDLYWYTTMTISNYSTIGTNGLYLFGPADLPFTLNTGYSFLAGAKVGNGIASIVLCNPLSGSKISIVAQSNLTGTQDCSVSAHLHGKKAV